MKQRRQRVCIGLLLLAVASVIVSMAFLRKPILERWLIWKLGSGNETERRSAGERLARSGSPRAIRAIIQALEEPIGRESLGEYVNNWITGVVVKLGTPAIKPVETVLLGHPHEVVRARAAWVLGKLGPEAVPSLLKGVVSPHENTRLQSITTFGNMGKDGTAAVPTLIRILRTEEGRSRLSSVNSLGRIGPSAEAARPDLDRFLEHEDEDLRSAAKEAIEGIVPGIILPPHRGKP